ncbi:maleylpyruvate isomerase family mycothiol-dependent enzyme [Nocardioides alcanivorans]|uniref:maleylpyruvate isomerase family mycothiol-dependent enzyme n=1 Tax=Nocardioides alcanivorans TaxID=2897352 RepID=UPI001F337215|nr:maleylpyruvate isomerase family mycothiol-dependent enzyme [Nocardioides alcanivorans]
MTDAEELAGYIAVWKRSVDDFIALMEEVPAAEWSRTTDLEGWDVHAVVAHIAHLEALLAGARHDELEIGEPPHVKSPMGIFTEQGVVARRDRTPDELLDEIRAAVRSRAAALDAAPPTDGSVPAPGLFGAIGWNQRTLLRNRPLDVWMHEQDVRRAIGRPGNLDGPAAHHVSSYLMESLGFAVAKRAGAPAGTTVVLEVDGVGTTAVRVNDSGRAEQVEPPADPTVRLAMPVADHVVLAGGRSAPADVRIGGDRDLADRILAVMGVTP